MTIARATSAASGRLHPLAKTFFFCALTPAFFYAGPLLLDPLRLLLLVITPILIVQTLSGKFGGPFLNDRLIVLYAVLYATAFLVNGGSGSLIFIGMNLLFILGGYFTGRATIRSVGDLRRLVGLLKLTLVIMLPLALYESITGQFIIPKLIEALPGISSVRDVNYDRRFGLDRAQVVWTHPIHLGLYASYAIGLFFILNTNTMTLIARLFGAAVIFMVCVFSVSSGPMSGILIQIGLISIWFATWKLKSFWKNFSIVFAIVFMILDLASSHPIFFVLADIVAFNSSTAYIRLVIFWAGVDNVVANPFLGIGQNEWARPHWLGPSIDNHWLLIAVQTGMPALLCIAGMFASFFRFIARNYKDKENEWDQMLFAVAVFLVGAFVSLSTVAVWSTINGVTMFFFGAFAFMFNGRPEGGSHAVEAAMSERDVSGPYLTGGAGRRRTVL